MIHSMIRVLEEIKAERATDTEGIDSDAILDELND